MSDEITLNTVDAALAKLDANAPIGSARHKVVTELGDALYAIQTGSGTIARPLLSETLAKLESGGTRGSLRQRIASALREELLGETRLGPTRDRALTLTSLLDDPLLRRSQILSQLSYMATRARAGKDVDTNYLVSLLETLETEFKHVSEAELKRAPVVLSPTPIPMILSCPSCSARHIDKGEFATKVHHTHACQSCGMCWRPAVVPTVGVQYLPGFKDEA